MPLGHGRAIRVEWAQTRAATFGRHAAFPELPLDAMPASEGSRDALGGSGHGSSPTFRRKAT